jgi:hypothetical protein
MKKACMRRTDKVWTLTYTPHDDGSIDIIDFNNEDNDGYMFESTLGVLNGLLEDTDRVVLEATIDGITYRVRNQQNVFTYKQPL